jgi:DNA-binding protein YbaB
MSQTGGNESDPSDLEALEHQVLKLRDALDDTECTAETADGLIEATVNGRLDPRIYRNQDCEVLAADILEAIHKATEQAQEKVARSADKALLPPDLPPELADLELEPFLHQLNRLKGRPT